MTARLTATQKEGVAAHTVANQLQALGVRGILLQMAKKGHIIELQCKDAAMLLPQGSFTFRVEDPPSS